MLKRIQPALDNLKGSDTGKAAGLAIAMIINNVIALGSSIVFARLINDYGSLAALISYLLILTVFGQAMQVATARLGVLGRLGVGDGLLDTLERWTRSLGVFTVVATVASILLRQPIADLVGVKHDAWSAAAGIPAACIYLEVSILRGALQAVGDYKSVGLSLIGEQATRLVAGAALALAGMGVAGAYLGSLISYVAMCGYCGARLYSQVASPSRHRWRIASAPSPAIGLWRHIRMAWVPIAGLAVIQLLQNLDLIMAKHQFPKNVASAYAVNAVAAKVLIWVAMGAGFYLVPETSRRRTTGEDTRLVLLRTLAIIGVCAIPCMLIYAFGAHQLLSAVFGPKRAIASNALLPLGAAFAFLAATYLAVQYMLALNRKWFLAALAIVAILEPVLLLQAPRRPAAFATVVLAVQIIAAVVAYTMAMWKRPRQETPVAQPDGTSESRTATPEPVA